MENKIDIKKEWEAPSFEKLEVIKTLGGGTQSEGYGVAGAANNSGSTN
jgi:hypothetical protein